MITSSIAACTGNDAGSNDPEVYIGFSAGGINLVYGDPAKLPGTIGPPPCPPNPPPAPGSVDGEPPTRPKVPIPISFGIIGIPPGVPIPNTDATVDIGAPRIVGCIGMY